MKVYFINNTGGGYSGEIEVEEGTTIEKFFTQQMGEDKLASDFAVTVNKLETSPSRVLQDGDTVTIVPGKYSGA
jgi:uncharacterized protein YneR